nr:nucleotide-binding alpha-beta plait domain-containing protein [Tanacetum cinerariifolium]
MKVKSFEEGLTEVTEMLKRLHSTLLLHQSELKESFRRARQDVSLASEKFHKFMIAAIKKEKNKEGQMSTKMELSLAKCECCGLTEKCTFEYIYKIREQYHGKWICGLCGEAIKDQISRGEKLISTKEAMSRLINFCKESKPSNKMTEPTIHLIAAMRQIMLSSLDSPRALRFINVFNTERLVNNLCTVWIDRYKIQANIAHFQRNNGNESKAAYKNGDDVTKRYCHSIPKVNTKANVNSWGDISYMGAVKGGKKSVGGDSLMNFALVLGDECRISKDLSLALLGRVKECASLANLKVAIGNEGFAEIIIKYMGELWVMLEFQSMETLNKFTENVSIASWFSQIIKATSDFETKGRIAWVEVEGVPLKLWLGNTFSRIATKWGKLLDVDGQDDICYHSKCICIYMKSGRSIKDEFNIMHRGKTYWIRANETVG